MEKVFCIGLNRTGTKSFAKAMRQLGRKTLPWSPQAFLLYRRNERQRLLKIIEDYDAFDDWPWPLMAPELMIEFPNAKFVLTRRSSEGAWLNSILQHAKKTPGGAKLREAIFGRSDPEGNEQHYVEFYITFYQEIDKAIERTSCRDRVLSVCWENGDGWSELCNFLGETVPARSFPHFNSSNPIIPSRRTTLMSGAKVTDSAIVRKQ